MMFQDNLNKFISLYSAYCTLENTKMNYFKNIDKSVKEHRPKSFEQGNTHTKTVVECFMISK